MSDHQSRTAHLVAALAPAGLVYSLTLAAASWTGHVNLGTLLVIPVYVFMGWGACRAYLHRTTPVRAVGCGDCGWERTVPGTHAVHAALTEHYEYHCPSPAAEAHRARLRRGRDHPQ